MWRRLSDGGSPTCRPDGKGTMGWCHGFKLHFICNDRGEIIMFCLTGANVDDRDLKVWAVLGKRIYGKLSCNKQ